MDTIAEYCAAYEGFTEAVQAAEEKAAQDPVLALEWADGLAILAAHIRQKVGSDYLPRKGELH